MIKIKESKEKFEKNPNKISIFATRTEQEILKDLEALGYRVKNDSNVLRLKNNFIEIYVYKQEQEYGKEDVFSCEANRFTMQEHKLLNELFEVIFDEC